MGAFYEAFDAARARQLVRRLEFRYTPKHGSWLNIAENELSALTRQCLHDRRFGDTKQLAAETAAWSTSSNEKQRGVDWPFHIDDARTKLKSLYPKLRCGKVILVVGPCEDVDQANGATALAQRPVVARENAQSSGSRRFQNSPPHRQ